MKQWCNRLSVGLVVLMLGIAPLHGVWSAPVSASGASAQDSPLSFVDIVQQESLDFLDADHCTNQSPDQCGSELDCSGSHCDFGLPWNLNPVSQHSVLLSVDDLRLHAVGVHQPHFRPPRSYRA